MFSKEFVLSDSDIEGRWPLLGDKAFVSAPPCYGASTAEDGQERLWRMVKGYRNAADLLVKETEIAPWERRNLIYPIMFAYRHSLELAIKQLLENHGSSAEQLPDFQSHKLDDTWPRCRCVIEHYNTGVDLAPLNVLSNLVKDFSEIDPNSIFFRYASDRNGILLDSKLGCIDLVTLRYVMAGIHNFFECVDLQIDDAREKLGR